MIDWLWLWDILFQKFKIIKFINFFDFSFASSFCHPKEAFRISISNRSSKNGRCWTETTAACLMLHESSGLENLTLALKSIFELTLMKFCWFVLTGAKLTEITLFPSTWFSAPPNGSSDSPPAVFSTSAKLFKNRIHNIDIEGLSSNCSTSILINYLNLAFALRITSLKVFACLNVNQIVQVVNLA